MIFSVEDRLFEYFPGLVLGVLAVKIDNTRYGDDILESSLTRVRAAFANQGIEEHPHVQMWRDAFAKVGMSDGPYKSSIESLLLQALRGGVFPRVNPLVDLYTAVSLEFLVPVGGHDISALDGDIRLGFAKGSEPFTPMEGGEDEVAEPGEVIYRDDHSVLTRGWVWRQSNKDRVSTDSTSVFMPVDILDGLSLATAEDVTDRIITYLHENRIGEVVYRDILTRRKILAEFTA
jgi:DNA/RNA-binding domain of Phe-tRNA-synthetase-like protein